MRHLLISLLPLLMSLNAYAAEPRATFICSDVTNGNERTQCIEKAEAFTKVANEPVRETPFWVSWIWPVGWWVLYYGFGLIVGGYVYRDAKKRDWVFLGIRPVWWAILVLFDPALGVVAYWAAHYSKLAQTYSEATAPEITP
jgi:hypothetical protein